MAPTGPTSAVPPAWRLQLERRLAAVPSTRRRRLRSLQSGRAWLTPAGGQPLLDLASNDYLGLSQHPAVRAAAAAELERSGLGAGASRLVSGSRPVHQQLEERLAQWLGQERVLLFPSGFQANLAAVTALADRHTLVLADRLIHHSLLVGVQASGARLRRFAHNDLADLERCLQAAGTPGKTEASGHPSHGRPRERPRRVLVLSESLFSMEGTSPDAAALADLCARHGAALLLDEAHALGVLGPGGRGLAWGLAGPQRSALALVSGTLGKAFGSGGAFLAGDAPVMEWVLQSSGPFRYTTALAPPLAAGALAALALIEAGVPQPLLARARRWRQALVLAGWPRPTGEGPILPLLVGDDATALALQLRLEMAGLLAVAIRPPTVPPGQARLRLVLRQDLPPGSLQRLLAALGPGPAAVPPAAIGADGPTT